MPGDTEVTFGPEGLQDILETYERSKDQPLGDVHPVIPRVMGPSVICERWLDCHLKTCHHHRVHEHMGALCESECRELLNQGAGPLVKACVRAIGGGANGPDGMRQRTGG